MNAIRASAGAPATCTNVQGSTSDSSLPLYSVSAGVQCQWGGGVGQCSTSAPGIAQRFCPCDTPFGASPTATRTRVSPSSSATSTATPASASGPATATRTAAPAPASSLTASSTGSASLSPPPPAAGCIGAVTVATLAGGGSAGGYLPGYVDGAGSAALFRSPAGAAVDRNGTVLFVADSANNLIRAVAISSAAVSTLAGGGSAGGTAAGFSDGAGSAAKFNSPAGAALDESGGVLYIADSSNNLIRIVAVSSRAVTTLAGGGGPAATAAGYLNGVGSAAMFNSPSDLAVDSAGGIVYVADTLNNLIRAIALSSRSLTTVVGGGGISGTAFGYADGVGTAVKFYNPSGIVVDGSTAYSTTTTPARCAPSPLRPAQWQCSPAAAARAARPGATPTASAARPSSTTCEES